MTLKVLAPRRSAPKHSDSVEWFGLDFSVFLAEYSVPGTVLSSVTWTVPAGITEDDSTTANGDTMAMIKLSGGTSGTTYDVQCDAVLSGSNAETVVAYLEIEVNDNPRTEYA